VKLSAEGKSGSQGKLNMEPICSKH